MNNSEIAGLVVPVEVDMDSLSNIARYTAIEDMHMEYDVEDIVELRLDLTTMED